MIIHALLGGLIGEMFGTILVIITLSVICHYLLDMIPHWDGHFDKEQFFLTGKAEISKTKAIMSYIDFGLAILIMILFYHHFDSKTMLLGMVASISPDLMSLGYKTGLKKSKKYMKCLKFHAKIQKDISWKTGLAIQVIVAVIILVITF